MVVFACWKFFGRRRGIAQTDLYRRGTPAELRRVLKNFGFHAASPAPHNVGDMLFIRH